MLTKCRGSVQWESCASATWWISGTCNGHVLRWDSSYDSQWEVSNYSASLVSMCITCGQVWLRACVPRIPRHRSEMEAHPTAGGPTLYAATFLAAASVVATSAADIASSSQRGHVTFLPFAKLVPPLRVISTLRTLRYFRLVTLCRTCLITPLIYCISLLVALCPAWTPLFCINRHFA